MQRKRPRILASESSWHLLKNKIRNQQAERDTTERFWQGRILFPGVSPSPSGPFSSAVLLRAPFLWKAPSLLTSGWGYSVSFSVFLVLASKKPLPPTPEDNRVSESARSGHRWAHSAEGCFTGVFPLGVFPIFLDFSNPGQMQQIVVIQLNSTYWVLGAWTGSWVYPCKNDHLPVKSSPHFIHSALIGNKLRIQPPDYFGEEEQLNSM